MISSTAKQSLAFLLLFGMLFSLSGCGSAPGSFQRSPAGWKSIDIRPGLVNDYSRAWSAAVDTIAREWDIEMMDKDSGYFRTSWVYGISGVSRSKHDRYRARIVVKFPRVDVPLSRVDVKTEAEWHEKDMFSDQMFWVKGFDTNYNRDVYDALSGRLGRTTQ